MTNKIGFYCDDNNEVNENTRALVGGTLYEKK